MSSPRWRAAIHVMRICVLGALLAPAVVAGSQRRKPVREFTRQGLLITSFAPMNEADTRLGRRAADAVRSHTAKLVDRRDIEVIPANVIQLQLELVGYRLDTVLDPVLVPALARHVRADEYIVGSVGRTPSGVRLDGRLVLVRDKRLRQLRQGDGCTG